MSTLPSFTFRLMLLAVGTITALLSLLPGHSYNEPIIFASDTRNAGGCTMSSQPSQLASGHGHELDDLLRRAAAGDAERPRRKKRRSSRTRGHCLFRRRGPLEADEAKDEWHWLFRACPQNQRCILILLRQVPSAASEQQP